MSDGGRIFSRVWKFGDDVNTDLIIPGKYLDDYDPNHLAAHAMEGASKGFAMNVRKGDIIVAGRNFGCGSSREQAVIALKACGIRAIIAKSFARIFYRNAINLGLTVMASSDANEVVEEGQHVTIDLEDYRVILKDGTSANLEPIPAHVRRILDVGGLVPYVQKRLEDRQLGL